MARKKKQTVIGSEISRPLPDIREVSKKIKAIREHHRKLAGMGKDQLLPSFDQLKRMENDSWVVVMRCDTMINQLRIAMLNEANKSKGNPEQWYRDLKAANDFILESE
jgi:hypothetical protein